jgi:two-component system, OmpR family, sensor histidine kinase YxdK
MSLIKLFHTVAEREKPAIIMFSFNAGFLALFYYLRFGVNELTYTLAISGFFFVAYFIYRLYEYKRFYEMLRGSLNSQSIKENLDAKNRDVLETINEIYSKHIDRYYKIQNKINARDTLLEQWIHNMKTSVAVIELASEKGLHDFGEEQFLKDIAEENKKLEGNLEETLNVFRLDEFAKDYVPEDVTLKELVTTAINSKKRDFIYKRVFPKVEIEDKLHVYTDKKWGKYMLEQIISNAIKYSDKENSIVVFKAAMKEGRVLLSIEDNGIGISKSDLPRVFEAFFTGGNGRKGENSSGIGLYMVKLVSEELGHKINIRSEVGQGTIFEINYLSNL